MILKCGEETVWIEASTRCEDKKKTCVPVYILFKKKNSDQYMNIRIF